MKKAENPAKVFLRRYVSLCGRVDALQRAIDDAMSRAFSTNVTLKDVRVISSPAEHDPMASDVCNAVDACELLYEYKARAEIVLREILEAVESLPDETQKELLTMRYIVGCGFPEIMNKMHYEKSQVFVIHGRALVQINKYLQAKELKNGA